MTLSESYQILQGIIQLLARNPDGLSPSEIANTFNVSRNLVPKYIGILEDAGVPILHIRKRYYVDEGYFTAFSLTTEESEFLYLILERSLALHSDRWQTLRGLLAKLSNKLTAPLADYLASQIDRDAPEKVADEHFRLLAQAKRERREVRVEYHALNRTEPRVWRIRPHRFTSNYFSDGLYIACHASLDGKHYQPVTFKLERITELHLTDQTFELVESARFATHLGQAWGVWHSERAPIEVMLRFEPRHYDRLLETEWHPTQRIRVDNSGYVIFSVEVSEPDEMVPWVRSWGSGVVVLEPKTLRDRIVNTIQRQMQHYALSASSVNDPKQHLWAKYDRKTGAYHLLLYHLLDVAAVAWQMWEQVLSASQREWIKAQLGMESESARAALALLVGLHDIGKATPGFQRKAESLYEALLAAGIPDERSFDIAHGILSAVILPALLMERRLDKATAKRLALVIGGHHGEWISQTAYRDGRAAQGGNDWRKLQATLFAQLADALGVAEFSLTDDSTQRNVFCAWLSGFVSVCDWIGSDDTYFSYETALIPPDTYFARAQAQAQQALSETGWMSWRPDGTAAQFEQLFAFQPNAMQAAVMSAVDLSQAPPRLILLEYLTGGGKTEIALYLADLLLNLFAQNGVYVAMPTQATSNQMFSRVVDYLQRRYPGKAMNMQLIHAQAQQHAAYQQLTAQPNREGNESALTAAAWFQNRKRALLAPFAVGTVDQAMLAVLQARHHFVRQYGLSHKTVIFDEIHAYDAYMNEIIERLLQWLDALNSPMILLSATLPRTSRDRLLTQVGASTHDMPDVTYPRLTIVDHERHVQVIPLPAPATRQLYLHFVAERDLLALLVDVYDQGGCVAIICNTVDEAIVTSHMLLSSAQIDAADVLLFHARTTPAWRGEIEQEVLRRFEKGGDRPKRMILVATQIIEQSLDLDFDLMISSIAPIDLLIQRAGRLHRHDSTQRPEHLQTPPTLVIREPEISADGVPDFGIDAVIYARYILLQTWRVLQDRDAFLLPDEIDTVMNAVYNPYDPATTTVHSTYDQALASAYDDMSLGESGSAFRGAQFCVGSPNSDYLIGGTSFDLPDDESRHIATRDIQRGIDIICLSAGDGPDSLPVAPDRVPTHDETADLLQYKLTVRKRAVLDALDALPTHPEWKRIPQLMHARPVHFADDIFRIPGTAYRLRLTPFFGLEIIEESDT